MPSVIDARLAGGSPPRDGQESKWEDWSFSFIAYCTLLDSRYNGALRGAAVSGGPVGLSEEPDKLALQTQLYYLSVCSLSGPVIREIKAAVGQNGLDAWRKLSQKYEPKTRNRQLALFGLLFAAAA